MTIDPEQLTTTQHILKLLQDTKPLKPSEAQALRARTITEGVEAELQVHDFIKSRSHLRNNESE